MCTSQIVPLFDISRICSNHDTADVVFILLRGLLLMLVFFTNDSGRPFCSSELVSHSLCKVNDTRTIMQLKKQFEKYFWAFLPFIISFILYLCIQESLITLHCYDFMCFLSNLMNIYCSSVNKFT